MSAPALEKRPAARKADEKLAEYYDRTAAARKAKRQELRERAWAINAGADDSEAARDSEADDSTSSMSPKTNPSTSGGAGNINGDGGVNDVVVVKYDAEDKPDQGDVAGKLTSIANLPYDADNVDKWVRKLERRMETGGIGSQ